MLHHIPSNEPGLHDIQILICYVPQSHQIHWPTHRTVQDGSSVAHPVCELLHPQAQIFLHNDLESQYVATRQSNLIQYSLVAFRCQAVPFYVLEPGHLLARPISVRRWHCDSLYPIVAVQLRRRVREAIAWWLICRLCHGPQR